MKKIICLLAVMAIMAVAAQAATISVNLAEGVSSAPRANQTLLPADIAGLAGYVANNWNNIQTDATGTGLWDDTGTSVGSVINFSITNAWGDGTADGTVDPPNDMIARGYFDDGWTSGSGATGIGVDIDVTNVPYSLYDVVVYMSTDSGTTYTDYTVNGQTQTAGPYGTFANIGGWVLGQNAMVFSNVTGATLDIEVLERYADGDNTARGTVSGFQIVEVPEPVTLVLLAIGGVFLRRRSA